MNDLESRIYRDAARIAAQVTPADIGPLDLSEAGGSGRPRPGRARPGAKWILAPVAAAVSVAVVAAVLVTARPGQAPHSPTSSKSARIKPPSPASRQLAAQALDSYFPASGATYTNGLVFEYAKTKITARDIDPCLAAAGFPQPAFNGSLRLYKLAFGDLSQFPDLAQLRSSPGQHYFTKQYLVLHHPTKARWRAIDRAQRRCTARFARAVTRVDNAAVQLETSWLGIISRIEHSRPVTATQPAFARCLRAHGVPASFANQTDPGAENPLFTGFFAWGDSNNQTATSASQLAKDQRRATRVFVACAPPVVRVIERLQLHERTQFFRAHAAEIARIARLAEKISDRS